MKYQVLFNIEKLESMPKLKKKLANLKEFMKEQGHACEIEIIFAGDVVNYFRKDYQDMIDPSLDIAICNNALTAFEMEPINEKNIRTVPAGLGELIVRKAEGWIDYSL